MAIFAHPDDEGQTAGLMAKYAAEGAEVSLVCATRGELGSTQDPSLTEKKTIAELREKELWCACSVLGVRNLRFLDYQEGSLHKADPQQVVHRISKIIEHLCPQLIITFGPEGVYGHRDHIAVGRWATTAFQETRRKSRSQPVKYPAKLYHTAYPRSLFDRLRTRGIEFRIDMEGTIHRIEGVPDRKITTVIDVSGFWSQKKKAFGCHESQLKPGDFRWMIMEGKLMDLLATERLVRVFPAPTGGGEIERDLFDSISLPPR